MESFFYTALPFLNVDVAVVLVSSLRERARDSSFSSAPLSVLMEFGGIVRDLSVADVSLSHVLTLYIYIFFLLSFISSEQCQSVFGFAEFNLNRLSIKGGAGAVYTKDDDEIFETYRLFPRLKKKKKGKIYRY